MNTFGRIGALGVVIAILGVSGCTGRDHGPYRYENGDRIDHDGHREVNWCDAHRDDEHCHR
jgi:hypothetical protein